MNPQPLRPLCGSCGELKSRCECDPLLEAFTNGTDREWTLALRDYLIESFGRWKGEELTPEFIASQANNLAMAVAMVTRSGR